MDQAADEDDHVGHFNGVWIDPPTFSSGVYALNVTFEALTGPAACGEAVATMTNGETAATSFGSCSPTGNSPPVAHDLALNGAEDTALPILLTGEDPDGDPLSFTVVRQPVHGALSGSGAGRTYTPDVNYNGPDSFEFIVNDGRKDSARALVSLALAPVNDPPAAEAQSATTGKNTSVDVNLSASDPDGDVLAFAITAAPGHGVLSGAGSPLVYTPDDDFTGDDAFTFSASDGVGGVSEAVVSINVKKGKGAKGGGGRGKPK